MLKISEFARLTRIPVKTLRYYDDIHLLKPAQVDQFTGYRYYAVEQLPQNAASSCITTWIMGFMWKRQWGLKLA